MAMGIAVLCLVGVLVSIPLVVLKPSYVFYLFLISCLFGNVTGGYIAEAGNLGMPRTWQPGDILIWLTLVAALCVPSNRLFGGDVIRGGLVVIVVVAGISLAQGLAMYTSVALTESRLLRFVAAACFALRYFNDSSRVRSFLNFTTMLIIVMFVFHVLLRLGVFVPPIVQDVGFHQLAGERGERSFGVVLYLMLLSIAIGRLTAKAPRPTFSAVSLIVAVAGILLSETRSLYGALAVCGLISLLFVRGRVKTLFVYGLALLMAIWAATFVGLDLTRRFRANEGRGQIVNPLAQGPTYRSMEWGVALRTMLEEPHFILTGRGIGATHYQPGAGETTGYHAEFLGWLDKFGVIGLGAFLTVWGACLLRSFQLARSKVPPLNYYGTVVFLLMATLPGHSFFSPSFLNFMAGPFFACAVVIIANRDSIYRSMLYRQPAVGELTPYERG